MPTVILDLPGAIFAGADQGNGNELMFDEKLGAPDDATKLRFGAWPGLGTGYIASIVGDVLTGSSDTDKVRGEVIAFALKRDEENAHPDAWSVELSIQTPGRRDDMGADQRIATFGHDYIRLHKPVRGLPSASSAPAILQSPNGRLVLAAQDDGNLVLYDNGVPIKSLFGLPADQRW